MRSHVRWQWNRAGDRLASVNILLHVGDGCIPASRPNESRHSSWRWSGWPARRRGPPFLRRCSRANKPCIFITVITIISASQRRTLPSIYDAHGTHRSRLSSSKLRNQLPSASLKAALLTLNHLNRQYSRQHALATCTTRAYRLYRCPLSLEEGTAIRVEIDPSPLVQTTRDQV